ncbi:MAG: DNA-binding protein [Desulfuromonadales bacterium]|nr:DNA-binding protein [Desulfuromonadales bacterium]
MHEKAALEKAEQDLRGMLKATGLLAKGSYQPQEVQDILGISESEFHRMINRYERRSDGVLRNPCSLDSFVLNRHRRVRFGELVDFLRRNNSAARICG